VGSGGARALASRPSPWTACPRLLAPRRGADATAAAAKAAASGVVFGVRRYTLALYAGGAIVLVLSFIFVYTVRARVPCPVLVQRFLKWLDIFSMAHELDDHQVQIKRRTASGGVCTLLAFGVAGTFSAYMVVSWLEDNTLVQRSLDALDADGGVWAQAAALPWATTQLPGFSTPTSGVLVRITADGDPGACGMLRAPPLVGGLVKGTWVLAGSVADCGGSGLSQLTYACADCVLSPASSISFLFHYSCQSLLVEAGAVAPYPADAATLLAADVAATAAAPRGGELLTHVMWDVGPLLGLLWDNVTASASKKGYAMMKNQVEPARSALAPLGTTFLTLTPLAAAVNVTVLLPLSSTYVTTLLTERVPWTQLVSNIVGLGAMISGFGIAFGFCEGKLVKRSPESAGAVKDGGDNDEAVARGSSRDGAGRAEFAQLHSRIALLRRDIDYFKTAVRREVAVGVRDMDFFRSAVRDMDFFRSAVKREVAEGVAGVARVEMARRNHNIDDMRHEIQAEMTRLREHTLFTEVPLAVQAEVARRNHNIDHIRREIQAEVTSLREHAAVLTAVHGRAFISPASRVAAAVDPAAHSGEPSTRRPSLAAPPTPFVAHPFGVRRGEGAPSASFVVDNPCASAPFSR
jgi:hypothetical protein